MQEHLAAHTLEFEFKIELTSCRNLHHSSKKERENMIGAEKRIGFCKKKKNYSQPRQTIEMKLFLNHLNS